MSRAPSQLDVPSPYEPTADPMVAVTFTLATAGGMEAGEVGAASGGGNPYSPCDLRPLPGPGSFSCWILVALIPRRLEEGDDGRIYAMPHSGLEVQVLYNSWIPARNQKYSGSIDSLDLVSPYLFRYKKSNFLVKDLLRPNDLDALLDIDLRPSDVFLVTYPKSGTVWMQQVIVQVMDEAHPEQAEDTHNRVRVPWLEERTADDPLRQRPDPRIFGSHLPPDMLPHAVTDRRVKIVYVWRNPKDILVSSYYFAHSWVLLETPKSFEDFFQEFLDGKVYMGSWFDHVSGYFAAQKHLNIHFVQYENMLKDLRGEVVRLCSFLGVNLSDEAIDRVVEKSTFKSMKTDPKANYKELIETQRYLKDTMRKGMAGDWKSHFTVEQNERFDRVYKEKMKNSPLTCTWDLSQKLGSDSDP